MLRLCVLVVHGHNERGAGVTLTLSCQYFFTSSHDMQLTAFSQPNTGSTRGGGPTMGTCVQCIIQYNVSP